jgi:hypothetical protein
MNVVTSQIAVFIHIPGGVVILRIQAVHGCCRFRFLVSAVASGPEAKIGDDEDGLGELDVQIDALIVKIVALISSIL